MAVVDVMDETFIAAVPAVVAAEVGGPDAWAALWPDLRLAVLADRGVQGVRWRVGGAWTGSMEVWLEPVLDGTVLHYFLRLDPAAPEGGTGTAGLEGRAATREAVRRQRAAKAVAFALKDRLELGRPPGVAPTGDGRVGAPAEGVVEHVVPSAERRL